MFGAGGSSRIFVVNSSGSNGAWGGQGGASLREKPVKVTLGTTYSLVVGTGGAGRKNVVGTINGNSGGMSSAFGITCNGGLGGDDSESLPIGNSLLCNKGTRMNELAINSYDTDSWAATTYSIPDLNIAWTDMAAKTITLAKKKEPKHLDRDEFDLEEIAYTLTETMQENKSYTYTIYKHDELLEGI
ncbi:glycine-rich domain-containing protein [Lysinibacillus sp. NPDC093712]|uniref:glycine-rich domain-containing protein n=1 Tax=Lysinibacillus sp. NPDC093712 TaxID=3390579 RepID=UPI003D03596D